MIREAVFTTLFNLSVSFCVIDPNHTEIENVRTLSITALQKLSMTCVVKPNDLNLLKKYSRCWAFLTIFTTFSSHLRLLGIVEPRNLKCWTISTVLPSITRGEGGKDFFVLKSTIISFVLFTLSSRLLSLHQLMSLFTWSRYSDSSEFVISYHCSVIGKFQYFSTYVTR